MAPRHDDLGRRSIWRWLWLSLALSLVALAYFYRLDRPLLWGDEADRAYSPAIPSAPAIPSPTTAGT